MASNDSRPIVVRRIRKVSGGGHHGGAWKVAYADFVTAMMAFFMVMWLIGAGTNQQRAAISDYFENPSFTQGKSLAPVSGPNGPGGASTSMIKAGGSMEIPRGPGRHTAATDPRTLPQLENEKQLKQKAREAEKQRLQALMKQIEKAIAESRSLAPFKEQLLLDITSDGLRIQIVDKLSRPMFDVGSSKLQPYTLDILRTLAGFLNEVPNRISISGHTDVTQYANAEGYTNWELSVDRAAAARRALVGGGMDTNKIARVVGLASSVLFDAQDPKNPVNRRISIVVMNNDAEQSLLGAESAPGEQDDEAPAQEAPAAPPAAPGLNTAQAPTAATATTPATPAPVMDSHSPATIAAAADLAATTADPGPRAAQEAEH